MYMQCWSEEEVIRTTLMLRSVVSIYFKTDITYYIRTYLVINFCLTLRIGDTIRIIFKINVTNYYILSYYFSY